MSQLTLARVAPRPSRTSIERTPVRRLRVVDAAPATHNHSAFAMLCLALALLGLLCALVVNTVRAEGSFVLGKLQTQATSLHDQRVTLQAQLSEVSSPDSLASRAAQLGLFPSPSTATLRLSDNTLLGVAAAVDPATSFTVVGHASSGDDRAPGKPVQSARHSALQEG